MAGAGGEGAVVVDVVALDCEELAAVAGPGAVDPDTALAPAVVFVTGESGVVGPWAASEGPASASAPTTAPAATTGSTTAAPIRTPRVPTPAILRPHQPVTMAGHRLTQRVTAVASTPYTARRTTPVSCHL